MREETAELRGAGLFGRNAIVRLLELTVDQPLLLSREPMNPKDHHAIKVANVFIQPVGYVAREIAAVVAPSMDAGNMWLAKVIKPSRILRQNRSYGRRATWPIMLLWLEEPDHVQETQRERKMLRVSLLT